MPPHDSPPPGCGRLREYGLRTTRNRRVVLGALERAVRPLTPYAIEQALREDGQEVHRVSIHRSLNALERCGLAHQLSSTGEYLICRLNGGDDCHHFLICRLCGKVDETTCVGMVTAERDAAAKTGYRIERHLVEFAGLCTDCH